MTRVPDHPPPKEYTSFKRPSNNCCVSATVQRIWNNSPQSVYDNYSSCVLCPTLSSVPQDDTYSIPHPSTHAENDFQEVSSDDKISTNLKSTLTPPLDQPLMIPEPPEKFKYLFQQAMEYLSPPSSHALPTDSAVFYSADGDTAAAAYAFKWRLFDFNTIFKGMSKSNSMVVLTGGGHDGDIIIEILSAAMSRASSGIVRVFMPPFGLKEGSTFAAFEWPELVANWKVSKIIWLNKDNDLHTVVLWQAGDERNPYPLNTPWILTSPAFLVPRALNASTSSLTLNGQATTVSSRTTTSQPPDITPPPILPGSYDGIDDDDLDCWRAYLSYTSRSTAIDYAQSDDFVWKRTWVIPTSYASDWSTSTSYPPVTVLCDGKPRAVGSRSFTSFETTQTFYNITTATTYYPRKPTCTIDSYGSACRNVFKTYSAAVSSIESLSLTTVWPGDDRDRIWAVMSPPCHTVDSYPTTSTVVTCSLVQATIADFRALYWPVTTAGDFCANGTKSTIRAEETRPGTPNTARYEDMIFTSPNFYYYISSAQIKTFTGFSGGQSQWADYGTAVETATVSINPEETPISTIVATSCRYYRHGGSSCPTTTLPFNLADLNTAAASAYFHLYRSRSGENKTIYQDDYKPIATFPPVGIKSADPQWKICDTFVGGETRRPTYFALPTADFDPDRAAIKVAPTPTAPKPGFLVSSMASITATSSLHSPTPTAGDSDVEN
ncbi:hypothetical protein G7Y89_g7804 [Cudoniella acicularis]|uniref:Uncharacterized protein n=1 Tax=Cudoniella acicularis TaxID=354080 RepID=A0A8H4W176_9HELO|nr:hypothetical protein G7Y89_g7804 [Cudoniella acicularis]